MWDVIYGGAISAGRFSAPQALAMLSSLGVGLCSPLNVSGLARDMDAAHACAKARLADLAVSFTLWPCRREQGLLPKLSAFTDPVLARMGAARGYGREP